MRKDIDSDVFKNISLADRWASIGRYTRVLEEVPEVLFIGVSEVSTAKNGHHASLC